MLLRDWVVFSFDHFFSHSATVLFRDIEKASVCGALKLDFNGRGFCHVINPETVRRTAASSSKHDRLKVECNLVIMTLKSSYDFG